MKFFSDYSPLPVSHDRYLIEETPDTLFVGIERILFGNLRT
jgi:hypothetical protein